MSLHLDLEFLNEPLRWAQATAPDPVNIYDVLSDAWRETRVDKTLVFFLDPNERHGLGSLVVDALLAMLDGAPVIGSHGVGGSVLDAHSYLGSGNWEIATQVEYIDVLATNPVDGLAIVLENKIGHELNNPLKTYAQRALNVDGINAVVVVVLAPEVRVAPPGQEHWLSRSITYSQLTDAIRRSPGLLDRALDPVDRNQRRSMDLLQQFMEKRTREDAMTNDPDDAERVTDWRNLVREHQAGIDALFDARREVRRVLRNRRERLEGPIAERVAGAELATDTQTAGGGGGDWQQIEYHFTEADWSIGLCFSAHPDFPAVFVYHNPGRDSRNRVRDAVTESLALSDDALADIYLDRVQAILSQVSSEDGTTR